MNARLVNMLTATGLAVALCATASSTAAKAEKIIIGDAACGKCIVKEAKECQLTLTSDDGGKKVTYYVVANNVAKAFGKQVCDSPKRLIVTGTVSEAGGKLELTPTKIELAK